MRHHTGVVALRGALLVTALLGSGWALDAILGPLYGALDLVAAHGPTALSQLTFPRAVTALCGVAAACVWAWLAAITVLEIGLAVRATARTGQTCTTGELARRIALTAFGIAASGAVSGALIGPAVADPAGLSAPADRSTHTISGLALPDRTLGGVSDAVRVVATGPDRREVTVRDGDSLWVIAAGLLPPGASAGEIAQAWQHLRSVNADRIGPDPNLIFPGIQLRIPQTLDNLHGR